MINHFSHRKGDFKKNDLFIGKRNRRMDIMTSIRKSDRNKMMIQKRKKQTNFETTSKEEKQIQFTDINLADLESDIESKVLKCAINIRHICQKNEHDSEEKMFILLQQGLLMYMIKKWPNKPNQLSNEFLWILTNLSTNDFIALKIIETGLLNNIIQSYNHSERNSTHNNDLFVLWVLMHLAVTDNESIITYMIDKHVDKFLIRSIQQETQKHYINMILLSLRRLTDCDHLSVDTYKGLYNIVKKYQTVKDDTMLISILCIFRNMVGHVNDGIIYDILSYKYIDYLWKKSNQNNDVCQYFLLLIDKIICTKSRYTIYLLKNNFESYFLHLCSSTTLQNRQFLFIILSNIAVDCRLEEVRNFMSDNRLYLVVCDELSQQKDKYISLSCAYFLCSYICFGTNEIIQQTIKKLDLKVLFQTIENNYYDSQLVLNFLKAINTLMIYGKETSQYEKYCDMIENFGGVTFIEKCKHNKNPSISDFAVEIVENFREEEIKDEEMIDLTPYISNPYILDIPSIQKLQDDLPVCNIQNKCPDIAHMETE